MKHLILLVILLSLFGLYSEVRAVEYEVGTPIQLDVRATSYKTVPGIPVRLTITYSDKDDIIVNGRVQKTIDDPVTLDWQATGGQLSKWSAGDIKPLQLSFVAMKAGYYAINLTAKDSGRYAVDTPKRITIEITVEQDNVTVVPTIRVSANPQIIQLDRRRNTTITAQLLGKDISGKTVKFFTTGGTLSASSANTDANGLATVTLTVSRDSFGTVQITAWYGEQQSSTTVEVTTHEPYPRPPLPMPKPAPLPTYQPDFLIGVDPPTLPADGRSTAIVTVRLTDGVGRGLFRQIVDFTSPNVSIRPLRMLTDIHGYASVQLIAPAEPMTGVILAQSGAKRGYTTVTFTPYRPTPTGPPRLFMTVDPTTLLADGTSKVLVSVMVLDSDGYAISNAPVNFSSTLGTIQNGQVLTDVNGQAGTYLTTPSTPGIATVSVSLGEINAASQVIFQGAASSTKGLDIRGLGRQQVINAADRWYFRTIDRPDYKSKALGIVDGNGKFINSFDLNVNSLLARDQYGTAHGFGTEEGTTARIELLKPDGTPSRTVKLNLPAGCHLLDIQYAEPAGNLLVTMANPDGSKPEVHFFSPQGKELLNLSKGLESMPVINLGGDGYLAVALSGGTMRIYNPSGEPVADFPRTKGLPATHVAVSPGGDWVAVASALAGQTETPPRVQLFSKQGEMLIDTQLDGKLLTVAGKDGVLVGAPDRTVYLSVKNKNALWTIKSPYERALVHNSIAVIAGRFRDTNLGMIVSKIILIRISDGKGLGSQTFEEDFDEYRAITPPGNDGLVSVLTSYNYFKIPLPAEK